jgi:hypothetical protein
MEKMLGVVFGTCLLAVLVLALLILGLAPGGAEAGTPEGLLDFRNQYEQEQERRAHLDEQWDEFIQVRVEREDVLADFQRGRVEFNTVVEKFHSFNERSPIGVKLLQFNHPGFSADEYVGIQILIATYGSTRIDGVERKKMMRDVMLQLERRLQGKLAIPKPLEYLTKDA